MAITPVTSPAANDQFIGTEKQTARLRALISVTVDGKDMTRKLEPYLIYVNVVDMDAASTAQIELDDRDARLDIPAAGTPVEIAMGWESETLVKVFNGIVFEVEHMFSRKHGGRRMAIHCISGGSAGAQTAQMMQPMTQSKGDGAPPGSDMGLPIQFSQWISQVGKAGGLIAKFISPKLASKERDFWSQSGESPVHHIERMAREFGAKWRLEDGNKFVIAMPDDQLGAEVRAVWGENLIEWRVIPHVARSAYKSGNQAYFDHQLGEWKKVTEQFGLKLPGNVGAIFSLPLPAGNQAIAKQQAQGAGDLASWEIGLGRVLMNGEPTVKWQGRLRIVGARPGVDGSYIVRVAEHSYSRQGYTTTVTIDPTDYIA